MTNDVMGKLGKLVHKQNCSHDFFYFINYNIIIVQVRYITIESKEVPILDITGFYFCTSTQVRALMLSTYAEKEARHIQYGPLLLFQ